MYKLIRSTRRTISLQIKEDGQLVVRAPRRASVAEIDALVAEKTSWIKKHQGRLRERNKFVVNRQFLPGESFLYLGKSYDLVFVDGGEALVFDDAFLLARECHDNAKEHFADWYKEQALREITERVGGFAALAGLEYDSIVLSNAKKKWGSCCRRGILRFNWRLIMAPIKVVDYVVAHELAHLEFLDHSKNFWGKVEEVFPDYAPHRKWLRENGHLLYL